MAAADGLELVSLAVGVDDEASGARVAQGLQAVPLR